MTKFGRRLKMQKDEAGRKEKAELDDA